MFWDHVAFVYDLFEDVYNGRVYRGTGRAVAKEIAAQDDVLECACGTGAISAYIAPACRSLIATDYSEGMLRQAEKKLKRFGNVQVAKADITSLDYRDARFDKVVAGNVIHLLDDPAAALRELMRVCRPGGKVIIPTYINVSGGKTGVLVRLFGKAGADFKRQFDMESYQEFFRKAGFEQTQYHLVEGRMPCAIAVITRQA